MTGIELRKVIGAKVRSLRETRGWTQEDLAKILGKGPTDIAKMESGARPVSKIEDLLGLSDAFNMPLSYFFDDAYHVEPEYDRWFRRFLEMPDQRRKAVLQFMDAFADAA